MSAYLHVESDGQHVKRLHRLGTEVQMRFFLVIGVVSLFSSSCSGSDNEAAEIRRLEAENAALRDHVAGENSYQCTVLAYQEQADDGILGEGVTLRNQVIGASFVVDRATGLIVGGVGNNGTFESHDVVFTPPENRFYVVSESHDPNKHVEFLSIKDWAEGPKKPFLLIDSEMVISGTCQ